MADSGTEGLIENGGQTGLPVETMDVHWCGEVRAFTVRLLLHDGVMQMSKDFGCASPRSSSEGTFISTAC